MGVEKYFLEYLLKREIRLCYEIKGGESNVINCF